METKYRFVKNKSLFLLPFSKYPCFKEWLINRSKEENIKIGGGRMENIVMVEDLSVDDNNSHKISIFSPFCMLFCMCCVLIKTVFIGK